MRRAAKRDRNERRLVRRLIAHGFLWLANSHKGRPDGCALRSGRTLWCEIKEFGESFTPEQVETFNAMLAKGVPVYVLETEEDVDDLAREALPQWTGEGITVRDAKRTHKGKRPHRPGYSRARPGEREMCVEDFCVTSQLPGKTKCAKHEGKT